MCFAHAVRVHKNFLSVVNLTSSADRVCPGDTVIFTCTTDAGRLVWFFKDTSQFYFNSSAINDALHLDDFIVKLISVTGNVLISTATAHNVSVDLIKTTCSETPNNPTTGIMKTVTLGMCNSLNNL